MLLRGAAWGFFAWGAYGIWEYCALTIGPLLKYSDVTLAGWHWKLSLLLLAVYALSGIAAGTAAAVLVVWILPQKARASGRFQSLRLKCAATITLVLAFIVNAATAGTGRSILVFAVLAAGALLLCLFSERWADCLASIMSPWSVGVLLLAVGWTTENEFSRFSIATRLLAGTAVTAVYVAGAFSVNRVLRALAPAVGTVRVAGAALLLACAIWFVLENRSQAFDASASTLDPSKPNIILLSLDTVRADHLSLYAYSRNTTPNLVRLAQSATLFKHATAAGNITLVSHAAIFTGAYSSWTGVSHFGGARVPIPAGYPTLAEILAAHGYSTGAVAANYPFLSPAFSMNRGFQFFDNSRPIRMLSPGNEYCLRNGVQRVLSWYWYTGQFDMPVLEASDVNERAFRFIASALPARRPIFLFLNYMEAHERIPPARFRDMFPGRLPRLSHQAEKFFKLGEELANEGTHRGHEAEIAHFVSQYDGAIASLDDQIGKLMDRLKALGLFEHSLIVVVSDHGEGLGTGNYVGHGITVHEDQVYVPLLIKYPDVSEPRIVDAPAGHTDILPTILDVAGIAPPPTAQGHSLRGDGAKAPRLTMSEALPVPGGLGGRSLNRWERALYEGQFKYIESTTGQRELHDWKADPADANNLCAALPDQCDAMQSELRRWLSTAPKTSPTRTRMDRETLERLKSLGYVDR